MRVKCWVVNVTADKDPHVVFDLICQNVIGSIAKYFHHHVHDIINVCPTVGGGNTIDKADLLEVLIGDTDGHLPPE